MSSPIWRSEGLFRIRLGTLADFQLLSDFQERMGLLEPSRDVFQLDPPEIIRGSLTNQGLAHLLFEGDHLVGYQLLRFPGLAHDNLGRDLGWEGAERLERVFHFETIYLEPKVRGMGLHHKLHSMGTDAALLAGKTAGFATISPLNYPSTSNALRFGLLGVAYRKKYSGNPRVIFFRDFSDPRAPLPAEPQFWEGFQDSDFLMKVEARLSEGFRMVAARHQGTDLELGFS